MSIAAIPTVFLDNDTPCVTEWYFPPGAETGWHRHGYNYVVVPMMDGQLRIDSAGDKRRYVPLRSGDPYFRESGAEHNVINANDHEYRFIEIEFKSSGEDIQERDDVGLLLPLCGMIIRHDRLPRSSQPAIPEWEGRIT